MENKIKDLEKQIIMYKKFMEHSEEEVEILKKRNNELDYEIQSLTADKNLMQEIREFYSVLDYSDIYDYHIIDENNKIEEIKHSAKTENRQLLNVQTKIVERMFINFSVIDSIDNGTFQE
jgi:chromosome segregation ATPase